MPYDFSNRHSVKKQNHEIVLKNKHYNRFIVICYEFDLGKPIWLDATIAEFKRHAKARFTQDNFIEQIEFDYLEIHVIEED